MRSLTGLSCGLLAALLLGLCLFPSRHAAAANFTVNSLADTPDALLNDGLCADASGACTLRAAIQEANANGAADAIGFSVNGTINLSGALPDLSTNVTINGPGASQLTVRRDTGGEYRIFRVGAGVTASISGLTIGNGVAPAATGAGSGGGGVLNSGTLSMSGCTVSFNFTSSPPDAVTPTANGGGIRNEGVLTLTGCAVNNNATGGGGTNFVNRNGGDGGGIYNAGELTLTDCAVNSNRTGSGIQTPLGGGSGGNGGGIYNASTMRMTAGTVSGNVTGNGADAMQGVVNLAGKGGSGGGVYNTDALTVINCVVSSNTTGNGGKGGDLNCGEGDGGDGGGIANPSGTLKLSQSTIVANQAGLFGGPCGRDGLGGGVSGNAQLRSNIISSNYSRSSNSAREVSGGIDSRGYNYIGVHGANCCFVSTDRFGSSAAPGLGLNLDPVTLIPQPGSIAIDVGLARDIDDQPVNTDKRGATRPFNDPTVPPQTGGDNSDIGAFERQSTDPQPPLASPATFVHFNSPSSRVTEGCVQTSVTVERTGPLDGRSELTYVVVGKSASQRGDFTYTKGHITFNGGDDGKFIPVLISEDAYAEGPEELTVSLIALEGGTLSTQNTFTVQIDDNDTADGAVNPIDDDATFVGQHYHDFLSRQADNAGQAFWTNQFASCAGDSRCLDAKRVDVSAAFFLSIEFQQTGYFAIRVNKAAFGDQPGNPQYLPFLDETQELGRGVVVGQPGFEELLEAHKQLYAEEFVARSDFQTAHGSQNAEQYVDSLFAGTGATPTQGERDTAISAFGTGDAAGRARSLRSVVESGSVYNKLYNPAFVLMQYFAYLRRDPNSAPDTNYDGYNFWLAKLNSVTQPGEDARDERVALARVRRAEMIRAFLLSTEYRGRFQGDPSRGS
jgi:CSLREA domain-containing protein